VDAQSVKNADPAALKGYDGGKKVSGIKRHIAVDTQGLPHAVAVTTAEVTDRKGALEALKRCKPTLGRAQSLLCDSGYVGQPFAQGVRDILGEHVTVQIAKRSELHTFKVMPKALDCRAQLCVVGEEPQAMEELRALAQHQFAVRPSGLLGPLAQKTLNTFLERVYDLYAAALECNRDEFEAMVRRLHRGASKGQRAEIARFHTNPAGQRLCGRSAALQILAITRLLLRYCALHPIPQSRCRGARRS